MMPPKKKSRRGAHLAELNSKLGVDKVKLVTSPLHIDDTPQAGHNTHGAATPANAAASAQSSAPAPANSWQAARAKAVPVRGGTWPVDERYFSGPSKAKAPAKTEMKTVATGQLKTVVFPSG